MRVRPRLLLYSWLLLVASLIATRSLAAELTGSFRGALVVVRPFMRAYNLALSAAHLVIIVLAIAGTASKWARAALVGALVFVVAFLCAPISVGDGPFAPGSLALAWYRTLVFAPAFFRDLGLGVAALAFVRASRRPPIALLIAVDLGLIAARWAQTPQAVIATLHPLGVWWPTLLSTAFLGYGLRREGSLRYSQ